MRPAWHYVVLFAILAAGLFVALSLSTANHFDGEAAGLAVACALGASVGGFAGERLRARRRHRRDPSARA